MVVERAARLRNEAATRVSRPGQVPAEGDPVGDLRDPLGREAA